MTGRLPNLPRKPFVPDAVRNRGERFGAAFAEWSDSIDRLAAEHAEYCERLAAFDNRMARLQADWEGR